jgi:hypothetical protein
MRRKPWLFVIALLLLAVLGDTVAWYVAVHRMRAGLDAWIAARRATGWSVTTAPAEAGGWPLAATLTLHDVTLRGGAADVPGGLAWQSGSVVLRLGVLHPRSFQIDTAGPQQLRVGDGPEIAYTATRLHLALPLQANAASQASALRVAGLRASVPVGDGSDTLALEQLEADSVAHPRAGQGQVAVALRVAAVGIGLPPRAKWPLGPKIASIDLDAALDGPLPAAATLTAGAQAWRDQGGSLEVRHIATHWGPLHLSGTATLALDSQLQPMGAGTAKVTGYDQTLDALARNGLMSRSAAITAKAVLSLLAETPDTGPAEVEVPLSLQFRTLSMRQVPLVRLPELDWPRP